MPHSTADIAALRSLAAGYRTDRVILNRLKNAGLIVIHGRGATAKPSVTPDGLRVLARQPMARPTWKAGAHDLPLGL